jgi:hypothetical protein
MVRTSLSLVTFAALLGVLVIPARRAVAEPGPGSADSLAAPPREVRRWQTGAFAPDRLQHASLAFSSGLAIGIVTREPSAAAGGAVSLALVKELRDARRSHFDAGDLAAGALGAALATLATLALTR